jgi:hypothetical protein
MAFHWEQGIEYARYIDEDRQNIEVMYIVEDEENVHGRVAQLHVLPADENDDQFKRLLDYFSYDQIMEMTYSYNQNAARAFEEQVIAIAQKSGVLSTLDIDVVSEDFINKFIDVMFVNKIPDGELKEVLFRTKLRLFEIDIVKDSKNRELKSQLRKATSLVGVFNAMLQIEEEAKGNQ